MSGRVVVVRLYIASGDFEPSNFEERGRIEADIVTLYQSQRLILLVLFYQPSSIPPHMSCFWLLYATVHDRETHTDRFIH